MGAATPLVSHRESAEQPNKFHQYNRISLSSSFSKTVTGKDV